jgi:hypothetical protein
MNEPCPVVQLVHHEQMTSSALSRPSEEAGPSRSPTHLLASGAAVFATSFWPRYVGVETK